MMPTFSEQYLTAARKVISGELPQRMVSINPTNWLEAQKIVGLTLAASNETYIHPSLLAGLCEHIAEALQEKFDLGWKAAGGEIFPITKKDNADDKNRR